MRLARARFNQDLIKGARCEAYEGGMQHLVDLCAILLVALVFHIANRPRVGPNGADFDDVDDAEDAP
jgi:hypothetical protein